MSKFKLVMIALSIVLMAGAVFAQDTAATTGRPDRRALGCSRPRHSFSASQQQQAPSVSAAPSPLRSRASPATRAQQARSACR